MFWLRNKKNIFWYALLTKVLVSNVYFMFYRLFAGTFHCRAGWSTSNKPDLIFKNVTAKQRGRKEKVKSYL